MTTQTEFGLREYLAEEGRLLITSPSFDFDSYEVLGEKAGGVTISFCC